MICQTCGQPNQEKFCPNCGEKRYDPHSLSLRHVLGEAFESFTHADHNLTRTLKAVLTRPGWVPAEYVAGRRVRYMRPLAFFLVVNLVYFLLVTSNTFNQSLDVIIYNNIYDWLGANRALQAELAARKLTLTQYAPVYNELIKSDSKAYLALVIPVYALLFNLLFLRAKRTFIEHLVFAAYFVAALLLCLLGLSLTLVWVWRWLLGNNSYLTNGDSFFLVIVLVFQWIYLTRGFQQFYGASRSRAVVTGAVGSAALILVILLYRLALFFKVLYLSH